MHRRVRFCGRDYVARRSSARPFANASHRQLVVKHDRALVHHPFQLIDVFIIEGRAVAKLAAQ